MKDQRLSRRRFLQGVGVAGAVASAPGLLSACASGGGPTSGGGGRETLRVGLLVPLSGTYAPLGKDMQQGFQLYLDQHGGSLGGRPVEVVSAETEATPEVGLRAARRLVEEDRVEVVTGVVSSAVAYSVKDYFAGADVPLIISNAGANELNMDPTLPNVFRTSFTNRQPCFALGRWAAQNMAGETFACIAPDYAAGKEDVEGFSDAWGGEIAARIFPPFGTTGDYQPFLSEIRQSAATAVMAFFAGGEAINFVQQYSDFGLKEDLPLIGAGFLTDDGILQEQGNPALGIRTALHYTPLLDNERNQEFVSSYSEAYDATATTYATQSYDAAQLIDVALGNADVEPGDAEAFVAALEQAGTIASPRGEFSLTSDIHDPVQPVYLREVQQVDGELGNAVVEDLGEFQPIPEA